MVMSGPTLGPRLMSGSVVLLQPWPVLMSVTPVTTEGREDWAAHSWPHPSLAATLGRTCPPLTRESGSFTSPGQRKRADPVVGGR